MPVDDWVVPQEAKAPAPPSGGGADDWVVPGGGAPSSTQPPSTFLGRVAHGFESPMVGMDVLASQAEQHIPGVSKETAQHDLALAQQERKEFEAQGSRGFSGGELIGSLLNPLNYLVGGPTAGAGVASTLGRAAASGAAAALVQPEHAPANIAAGAVGGTVAGAAAEPLARAISGNTIAGLDKFIKDNFERAIKPSVSGKGTYSQAQAYATKVGSALNSIIDNRAGLRLLDEHGQPVAPGTLPQSLDQFAQAIDQTKQKIFQQYDAMAKAAGDAPYLVSLAPVVTELRKIAITPAVKDFSPSVANYATAIADRLEARGAYTAEEAQDGIQHINAALKGFYGRDPTRETVANAGVDALMANILRQQLDTTIDRAVGPGYQALRDQYGALRTLEKDVVHRAIVTGRQETGGGLLGRISDVISAEQVIHGILTFNPAGMATGAGMRAWRGFVRYLHSPNRAVKRIFEAADKRQTLQPSPVREGAAAAVRRVAPIAGGISVDNMLGYMQP